MENKKETFLDKLKFIFSSEPIIKGKDGKYYSLRKVELDLLAKNIDNNFLNKNFVYGLFNAKNFYSYFNQSGTINRFDLYRDYEAMDTDPIISSVLDIYADETCLKNDNNEIIAIKTDNSKLKEDLQNLFFDILNFEFNCWQWLRNLVKYGDFYLKLNIAKDYGVVSVTTLSIYDVERIESTTPNQETQYKIENYKFYGLNSNIVSNYEIAHFRLLSDINFLPYGKSILEGARKVWKQLSLMEDAMMIYRVLRAPEKRIFKIEVGNLPPNEVKNYIQKVIDETKRQPIIDPTTGDYNLRFNIENILEDYYLPVRGGQSGTSIETLPGLNFVATEDIEYLKNKLIAALKVPKAFLGYESDIQSKATLASEDLRFARTIERIQKLFVSELYKIAYIHLVSKGYTYEDIVNFTLEFSSPSKTFEAMKLENIDRKLDLARKMIDSNLFSLDYVYKNIFGLDEKTYKTEQKKILKTRMYYKKIENFLNSYGENKENKEKIEGDLNIDNSFLNSINNGLKNNKENNINNNIEKNNKTNENDNSELNIEVEDMEFDNDFKTKFDKLVKNNLKDPNKLKFKKNNPLY